MAYWLECSHGVLLGRDVIDDDAAIDLGCESVVEEESVGHLGNALVGSVAGLEEYVCGPVV